MTIQPALDHAPAELLGRRISRMVGLGPGRPEHDRLALAAIGREHLETVPQFANRGGEQFEIAAIGVIVQELVRRLLDLSRIFLGAGRRMRGTVRSGFGRLGVGDRVERSTRRRIGHVTMNAQGRKRKPAAILRGQPIAIHPRSAILYVYV